MIEAFAVALIIHAVGIVVGVYIVNNQDFSDYEKVYHTEGLGYKW